MRGEKQSRRKTMSKLNKIEGYCLEVIKEAKNFLNNKLNDDFTDTNTHTEKLKMAQEILDIITKE